MAWEKRGKRNYYYRKRRQGNRVVSEYIGAGEFAQLLAELDKLDLMAERRRQLTERREREHWLARDREVNQTLDLCSSLANAALLAAGYHTHKGQWRRKRGNQ